MLSQCFAELIVLKTRLLFYISMPSPTFLWADLEAHTVPLCKIKKDASSSQWRAGWILGLPPPLAWHHIALTNLDTIVEACNKHS